MALWRRTSRNRARQRGRGNRKRQRRPGVALKELLDLVAALDGGLGLGGGAMGCNGGGHLIPMGNGTPRQDLRILVKWQMASCQCQYPWH